jgi:hypothetical protein
LTEETYIVVTLGVAVEEQFIQAIGIGKHGYPAELKVRLKASLICWIARTAKE